MQLLAPDVLSEARGLSLGVSALGVAVGFLLWLTGWRGHRFWIVLGSTVSAGIYGLWSAPVSQVQPLVAALLMAVAAGLLALSLVRLVAFAAGGIATWLVVHAVAPAAWDEPLICFLAGGLVGLLLFRLWTMVLTSFCGTILLAYSGLCLLDRLGKLDAVGMAEGRAILLNWACAGLTLLGVVLQVLIERRRVRKEEQRREEEELEKVKELQRSYEQRRWWSFGRRLSRRAG